MIEIYGNTNCVWCDRAKALCEQYNLGYNYKMIQDDGVLEELQERVGSVRTVPQIFWHGKHVGGYTELASEIENTREFGQEKL